VYDVPGFKFQNKGLDALGYLTRHWEWTGTTTLQSGLPDTIYAGGLDSTAEGHSYSGRPSIVNASAPMTNIAISGSYPYCWPGEQTAPYYDWATCAPLSSSELSGYHFLIPFGTPGNVGRNTYILPGIIRFNWAINRNIPIPGHETQFLQMRVEMFNPFNHPNRSALPGGLWTTDVNTIMPDNPSHLFDTYWARQGARSFRLSLKYQF
jgi:hypothetical protein